MEERAGAGLKKGAVNISVIIPALDEEALVEGAVTSAEGAFEVIVVDGGSKDLTCQRAQAAGARLVSAPVSARGRGPQMDFGAAKAGGEVFLFLHADTRLPARWKERVGEAFGRAGVTGGSFTFSIGAKGFRYRLVEFFARFRSTVLGLVYGDQAIFVSKEAFGRAGGFKLPLMEDVDCVNRLKSFGSFVQLRDQAVTSARRCKERGVVSNTLRNWSLLLLFFLGVSPGRLYSWYYNNKE